jgi:hypothetical protein
MKKRFTEAQIVGFLREADAGLAVKHLDPAGGAPQVRVDRVLDDEAAVLLEVGPDLGGQEVDRLLGNEAVRLEPRRRSCPQVRARRSREGCF